MRMVLVPLAALLASAAVADPSGIGYPSVDAAMKDVRGKDGVNVSVQSGWTVIEDRANNAVWSFAPPGHAAYPSAVQRTITQRGDQVVIDMTIKCEAAKSACDQLVVESTEQNNKIREAASRR
jgi:hypothetical protein